MRVVLGIEEKGEAMKILLLTTHLDTGGIPIYVVGLARGLKQAGHDPVVVSSGGWLEKRLFEMGIRHYKVPCHTSSELNPKLWTLVFPSLLRIVHNERPDLVHAHTRVTQVLAQGLRLFTGVTYVTTCHGLYRFRIGRRLFRCWGKSVMAISEPSMERLVVQYKLAPPRQVVLVVNGVEVNHFVQSVPQAEVETFKERVGLWGDPIVGAIARLSPVKGFDDLLKAVPALLKSFPRLQVLLVGDGPSRDELTSQTYQLGIQRHVIISHPMEDTRIPLAAMQLFVSAALEEGFGLSIVEAMAAGVPVIATNVGGPAKIIQPERSGLLVPPRDSQALGEAIKTLLSTPEKRVRIIETGRERASTHFDMRRVVRQVEEVYDRSLA